jgi:hypothetical protein
MQERWPQADVAEQVVRRRLVLEVHDTVVWGVSHEPRQ